DGHDEGQDLAVLVSDLHDVTVRCGLHQREDVGSSWERHDPGFHVGVRYLEWPGESHLRLPARRLCGKPIRHGETREKGKGDACCFHFTDSFYISGFQRFLWAHERRR